MSKELMDTFLVQEDFARGKFLGDNPAINNLSPQERVYVSAWRHGCPEPDTVVDYYGKEWLKKWKRRHKGESLPSDEEVKEHGISLTRRRYDECDNVYEGIVEKVRACGKSKKNLLFGLTTSVVRRENEPMGFHEVDRVPKSHETEMAPLSGLVLYALPRVQIEAAGWDGRKRTWKKYEKSLEMLDAAIAQSNTKEQLLATLAESVYLNGGRPDKILSHVLASGIEVEENNHAEYRRVKKALAKYAPNLWRYQQDRSK